MTSIIQWNCRGYNGNFEELKTLLSFTRGPACVCLQETFHGILNPQPPRNYSLVSAPSIVPFRPGVRASRGVITLVHSDVPYHPLTLTTTLEAVAIRLQIQSKPYTVCNLYLSPTENVTGRQLQDLIAQLPRPFLVLGDFNARHPTWGDDTHNPRGRIVAEFLLTSDVCLLNTGHPTHFHVQTASLSCIDLSFSSPDCFTDFLWEREDDLYGSDHFPLLLTCHRPAPPPEDQEPRYLFHRANWNLFRRLTRTPPDLSANDSAVADQLEAFLTYIHGAARLAIPMSVPGRGSPVPWWTAECARTHRVRKSARRRYQRTRSDIDRIALNRATAIARHTKRQARRQSWRDFVSSINSTTPISKVWKKISKISGKYRRDPIPCIHHQGELVVEPASVADLLAAHMAGVSSTDFYTASFNTLRQREERRGLNFHGTGDEPYNSPITLTEFLSALRKCKNTASGSDGISYLMLKHLSISGKSCLLRLFNFIFASHTFPPSWRSALLLPFRKPNKPPTSVDNYRPIALTSCLCKLLEKILNARLVYHLESSGFFAPSQYGYRKFRGTLDSLATLQTAILAAFSAGNTSRLCFLI